MFVTIAPSLTMQSLSPAQLALLVPLSIVALDVVRRFLQRKLDRKGLSLPPGPTPIPLLGNILSINREEPWKTYTEWHAIYGDIFYLRILNQDIVVLGSRSIAVELLEKRSKLYSDRPFVATLEPYGIDCIFGSTPYGEHWRSCRRIFHQTYRADTALNFHPMQLRKARQLTMDMIDNPTHYEYHYAFFGIAVPLSASYGYEVEPQDDLIHIFKNFAATAIPVATPEQAVFLRLFPLLLQIPDWLPGSSLKHEVNRTRDLAIQLTEIPYRHAEERLVTSNELPMTTMVSAHLTRVSNHTDEAQRAKDIFDLKKTAVSSIIAGSDTVVSTLMAFTLAVVLNPRVSKRAQEEIDAIVGIDRLPNFGDRPALPYINATIREVLRWCPPAPLGVWHATSNSDVYNGQYIPRGATVVANIWAMSRDETRFPNAEEFVPERFLDDRGTLNDNDPMDFVFGFGRRVCPARHTADGSLFAAIATMLATLDFSPLQDAQNTCRVEWVNGITRRPKSFPCRISPRAHVDKSFIERMRVELNRV